MLIYNIYTDSTEFIRKKSSLVGEGCDHFLFARGGWFTLLEPQKSDHTGIFQKNIFTIKSLKILLAVALTVKNVSKQLF
jgi:hypothetical protein